MNKYTAWETYFPGTKSNEEYKGKTSSSPYSPQSTSSHLYIFQCTFNKVTKTSIQYSTLNENSKLLVELSSFNFCSSSQRGGAISDCDSGQCILSSVCGVKCTSEEGQFCYLVASYGYDNKNYIIDSSVTSSENTKAYYTLYQQCGDVSCEGVNVSNNVANSYSGLRVFNPSISSILFCSFKNNTAAGDPYSYVCLDFLFNSHKMNHTNIIENNQQSLTYGIIYTASLAELTMSHCSVYGNCNNKKGKVFYVSSGVITCNYCSIGLDQVHLIHLIRYQVHSLILINS